MIAPYKRTPPAPAVGLVRKDRRVLLDDGTINKISDLKYSKRALRLYGDRDLVRNRFLNRGDGYAVAWNGLPVRWLPDEAHDVILLGAYPEDGPEILEGLVTVRDYLASKGAAISSAGSSSMSLLRASLSRPLLIDGGDERPDLGEVIGGRQEAFVPPGHYGSFVHYDLSAAYSSTLGGLVYPGRWQRWAGLPDEQTPWPGFVRVRLRIPKHVPGPVPRRKRTPAREALIRRIEAREYPVGRTVTGTWTIEEFRAALRAGAKAEILDVFLMVGAGHRRPFERWYRRVSEMRKLPGYAGTFSKTIGNALWGRFVTFGDRTLVHYEDGKPVSQPYPIRVLPREMQGLALAETVTGRVRARLYEEMIRPHRERLLSVHTDGGLLGIGEHEDRPKMPEGWRAKETGSDLVYVNPQAYAFSRSGVGRVYKISGVRPDEARRVFDEICRIVFGYPASGSDGTDADALTRLVEAFPEFADQIPRRKRARAVASR